MHKVWIALVTVGLIGFGIFTAVSWRSYSMHPLRLDEEVVVDSRGFARQSQGVVARVRTQGNTQEIVIPLISNPDDEDTVSGIVRVSFPVDVNEIAKSAEVVSIQGPDPFKVRYLGKRDVSIQIAGAIPEGKPAFVTRFANGTFKQPFYLYLLDWLAGLNIPTWAGIGLLGVLLTHLITSFKTRSISWNSTGLKPRVTPPGDLRPLELAILHHSTIRPIDLASLLYDLAGRGYLQVIAHSNEDISFARTEKQEGLSIYEKNFLLLLFPDGSKPIDIQELIGSLNQELFSAVASQLYIDIYDSFTLRWFFKDAPRAMHLRYKTTGIVMQFAGLMSALFGYVFLSGQFPGIVVLSLGIYAAGVVVYRSGYRIIPLSPLGKELIQSCVAFRRYLTDPKPLLPPQADGELFFSLIPYALVLDCGQEWLNRFAELNHWYIPDWYTNVEQDIVLPSLFVNQVEKVGERLALALGKVKDPNVD